MVLSEIICASCGWSNEPTARMCGGCGQPLPRASHPLDPGATTAAVSLSDERGVYARGIPQPSAPRSLGATLPANTLPAGGGAPAVQAPQTPMLPRRAAAITRKLAPEVHGLAWWRGPLLVVVALALLIVGLGAMRASLHTTADDAFASALRVAVKSATHRGDAYIVSTDDVVKALRGNPQNAGVSDPQLSVSSNGFVTLRCSYLGFDQTVSTNLEAASGRVRAYRTSVDYPLAFAESPYDMEATFDNELQPPAGRVTDISFGDGTIVITTDAN